MGSKTFIQFYEEAKSQPTPGKAFVLLIASLTNKTKHCVRKWISGESQPDINTQKILEDYFNVPCEILFPPKRNKNI